MVDDLYQMSPSVASGGPGALTDPVIYVYNQSVNVAVVVQRCVHFYPDVYRENLLHY